MACILLDESRLITGQLNNFPSNSLHAECQRVRDAHSDTSALGTKKASSAPAGKCQYPVPVAISGGNDNKSDTMVT